MLVFSVNNCVPLFLCSTEKRSVKGKQNNQETNRNSQKREVLRKHGINFRCLLERLLKLLE